MQTSQRGSVLLTIIGGIVILALLGMVAILFPEKELTYKPSTMSFINCPEADRYVKSLYAYNKEFLPSKIRL